MLQYTTDVEELSLQQEAIGVILQRLGIISDASDDADDALTLCQDSYADASHAVVEKEGELKVIFTCD